MRRVGNPDELVELLDQRLELHGLEECLDPFCLEDMRPRLLGVEFELQVRSDPCQVIACVG